MIEINLPKTYDRITLQTFCDFHNAKTDIKRMMVITGKTKDQCEQMQFNTIDTIITMFEEAMEVGTPKHQNQFNVGAMKLGFIPDMNGLSFREYVDLDALSKTIWKEGEVNYTELPRLMSILFRPVVASVGEHYTIAKYDSSKINDYLPYIKQMTMDRINGALVFFRLSQTNCTTILKSICYNRCR